MSRTLQLAHGAATLALGAALVWQVGQTRGLSERIATLEAQPASGAAPASTSGGGEVRGFAARSDERKAMRAAVAEAASAARAEGMDEEQVAELVETRMEEMLDAREARQRDEQTQQWLSQASEGTLIQIEKLAEEHQLSEQAVAQAHEIVVDSLYFTVDLKQSLSDGDISVRQAQEDGNEYLADMRSELVKVMGEEATEELGWAIRPGMGWKAR